jgi:hypothetical protein
VGSTCGVLILKNGWTGIDLVVLLFAAETVLVATQFNTTGSLPVVMVEIFDEECLEGTRPLLHSLQTGSLYIADSGSFDWHQIYCLRSSYVQFDFASWSIEG